MSYTAEQVAVIVRESLDFLSRPGRDALARYHRAGYVSKIENGELTCIGPVDDPGVFIVTDTGEMFALNPAAIRMADRVGTVADLEPIWRWRDPEFPTERVKLSPMILYALTLC